LTNKDQDLGNNNLDKNQSVHQRTNKRISKQLLVSSLTNL